MKGLLIILLIGLNGYAQDSNVCKCTTYIKDTVVIRDTVRITDTVRADKNIVFFGSSTIFNWNVATAFPGYPVKKIGYGGKTWAGLLPLADSIKKLNPKQVIVYSGDNDVIARRSVSAMATDIQNLISKIWQQNDSVQVVFLYTKPSDTAFKIMYSDGVTRGYQAIEYTNRNVMMWGNNRGDKFKYVDTYSLNLLWNPKRLNTQLYGSDLLHLNHTYGYPKWNESVKPVLIN